MGWDWKSRIGSLFGTSAQPPAAPAPEVAPAAPEIIQAQEQLAGGAYRSYNRAELKDITEALRDLKDATRHNMVVIDNLMKAQPKQENAAVKDLLANMKTDLASSHQASEKVMVELNSAANTLERITAQATVHSSAQQTQSHLPVYDVQKNLVISMTMQLREIYTVHNGLTRIVGETKPYINLPETDRVCQALEKNDEKLPSMISNLTRLTVETVGRAPQPAPQI